MAEKIPAGRGTSASQPIPAVHERQANDGGTLVAIAIRCRRAWPASMAARACSVASGTVRRLGCRPLVVKHEGGAGALLLVVESYDTAVAPAEIANAVVAALVSKVSALALRSFRQYGLDGNRRYHGPVAPYWACISIYARDHGSDEQVGQAVTEVFPRLSCLLQSAQVDKCSKARTWWFVTLGRHGGIAIFGSTVSAVHKALMATCLRHQYRLIIATCQPDHLHVVIDAPASTAPETITRRLRGGTSREVLKRCPWMRRTAANGKPLSLWDRTPDIRTCATFRDPWRGLERYLRGQSARHGRRLPPNQAMPIVRTSRLLYGAP